jgi:hypothetical protein
MKFSDEDLESLRYAKDLLENPGLAAKITNYIGIPIELAFDLLPDKFAEIVKAATGRALNAALHVAVISLNERSKAQAWLKLHKFAVAVTGAGGGTFGLAGLPIELPLSTTIMLRSISDIARSEGERLQDPEAKLACLEVFALGGRSKSDDANESHHISLSERLLLKLSPRGRGIYCRKGADNRRRVADRKIPRIHSSKVRHCCQ